MAARLFYRLADGSPATVDLASAEVRIGRDEGCEIRTTDHRVSGVHCAVVKRDGVWLVEQRGSTNPTYAGEDAAPLRSRTLQAGDVIRCGGFWVQYLNEVAPPPPPTESARIAEAAAPVAGGHRQVDALQRRAEKAESELADGAAQRSRMQTQLANLQADLARCQRELGARHEEAQKHLQSLTALTESLARERAVSERQHRELGEAQENLGTVRGELEKARQRVRQLEGQDAGLRADAKRLGEETEHLRQVIISKDEHVQSLRDAPLALQARLEERERHCTALTRDLNKAHATAESLTTELAEKRRKLEHSEELLRRQKEQLTRMEASLVSSKHSGDEVVRLTRDNIDLTRRLELGQKRYHDLQALVFSAHESLQSLVLDVAVLSTTTKQKIQQHTAGATREHRPELHAMKLDLAAPLDSLEASASELQGQLRALGRELTKITQ